MNNYWSSPESAEKYWDRRASEHNISYRRERFYTVTPLPFFLWRREFQRRYYNKAISSMDFNRGTFLDYGCGDGQMSIWIAKTFSWLKVFAYDISKEMVKIARNQSYLENVTLHFIESLDNLPTIHILNGSMVLAHMTDGNVLKFFQFAESILAKKGIVIAFEHVGKEFRGRFHAVRPSQYYETIAAQNGFRMIRSYYFDKPFYWKYYHLSTWYIDIIMRLFPKALGNEYLRRSLRRKFIHYSNHGIVFICKNLIDRFGFKKEFISDHRYVFFVFEKEDG